MNNIHDINKLKTPRKWKADLFAHVEQMEHGGQSVEKKMDPTHRARPVRVILIAAALLLALSAVAYATDVFDIRSAGHVSSVPHTEVIRTVVEPTQQEPEDPGTAAEPEDGRQYVVFEEIQVASTNLPLQFDRDSAVYQAAAEWIDWRNARWENIDTDPRIWDESASRYSLSYECYNAEDVAWLESVAEKYGVGLARDRASGQLTENAQEELPFFKTGDPISMSYMFDDGSYKAEGHILPSTRELAGLLDGEDTYILFRSGKTVMIPVYTGVPGPDAEVTQWSYTSSDGVVMQMVLSTRDGLLTQDGKTYSLAIFCESDEAYFYLTGRLQRNGRSDEQLRKAAEAFADLFDWRSLTSMRQLTFDDLVVESLQSEIDLEKYFGKPADTADEPRGGVTAENVAFLWGTYEIVDVCVPDTSFVDEGDGRDPVEYPIDLYSFYDKQGNVAMEKTPAELRHLLGDLFLGSIFTLQSDHCATEKEVWPDSGPRYLLWWPTEVMFPAEATPEDLLSKISPTERLLEGGMPKLGIESIIDTAEIGSCQLFYAFENGILLVSFDWGWLIAEKQ